MSRAVNILFSHPGCAPEKVSAVPAGLHRNRQRGLGCNVQQNNPKQRTIQTKLKSCGSKVLACPILLCLAGYEWIKDKLKKQTIMKTKPQQNLQRSLISSKSVLFASSPFHSLQPRRPAAPGEGGGGGSVLLSSSGVQVCELCVEHSGSLAGPGSTHAAGRAALGR